jgi:Icc-related predicted phosphoesterase
VNNESEETKAKTRAQSKRRQAKKPTKPKNEKQEAKRGQPELGAADIRRKVEEFDFAKVIHGHH